jgi:hypothetical protein
MMCAELCRAYGWTLDYILAMPVVQFFSMRKAWRALYAMERIDDCDVAAIPLCNADYYDTVRERFNSVVKENSVERAPVVIPDEEIARDFMFTVFARKKGL